MTVTLATVELQETPQIVAATGTVMPWQELAVDAETSGLAVVEVRVKENEPVRAGDVLVRFNDRALRAQVAQQAAAVAEAQATLQSARQEAARGDILIVQKSMSQEAVDTRRTAILTNQAKLDQAKATLDQLQAQLAPNRGVGAGRRGHFNRSQSRSARSLKPVRNYYELSATGGSKCRPRFPRARSDASDKVKALVLPGPMKAPSRRACAASRPRSTPPLDWASST